jgi:hypothetical protein
LYARGGSLTLKSANENFARVIIVIASDQGQASPMFAEAMRDGFLPRCGLGLGLPGSADRWTSSSSLVNWDIEQP